VVSPWMAAAVLVCATVAAGLGAYFAVLASRGGAEKRVNQAAEKPNQADSRAMKAPTEPSSASVTTGSGASQPSVPRWKVLAKEAANKFKARDFVGAKKLLLEAIASCQDNLHGRQRVVLLTNLGLSQQQLNEHEAATTTFTEILAESPGMLQALSRRARSYQAIGEREKALVDLLVKAVLEGGDQSSPSIKALYAEIVEHRLKGLASNPQKFGEVDHATLEIPQYTWTFYRSCFASDNPGEPLTSSELQIVNSTINADGHDHGKVHALTQRGFHLKSLRKDEVRERRHSVVCYHRHRVNYCCMRG